MSQSTTDLAPLNIIRTETVLSKLPIHNLAKSGKVDINIVKYDANGQTKLYWEVTANEKFGLPGQLAYKIDTIVINRILDELGRPVPKVIRLGSLKEICKLLGLCSSGRSLADIKKAILQNVGAIINAKMKYKGYDGSQQTLEASFYRYSVFFRGERLPQGIKADAVYLVLNDVYWEVLNNAPVRPLDYDYLKELSPAAQRFYEIISYRIFTALKYKHSLVKMPYSDYCAFSAQKRYYEYQPFRKQMYKIHRPHLESGYIQTVDYEQSIDQEGRIDWQMCYSPGPKARAEYKAFNGKHLLKDEIIDLDIDTARRSSSARGKSTKTDKQSESKVESLESLKLVQYFHKLARNIENAKATGKELLQAETMIGEHGLERASFIVEYAVMAAKETKFQMRTFGAVVQYEADAIAQYELRAQERERERAHKQAREKEQAKEMAEVEARLKALPKALYRELHKKAKEIVLNFSPHLQSHQKGSIFQSRLREEIVNQLDKIERKRG